MSRQPIHNFEQPQEHKDVMSTTEVLFGCLLLLIQLAIVMSVICYFMASVFGPILCPPGV